MPVSLSFPGVYIEEIPSGVHAITGVATSITAFLGRSPRGPLDAATTVNNFGEFQRTFGDLSPSYTLGYAVRDFFTNGGGQAVIVRRWLDDGARAAVPAALTATKLAATTALAAAGATPATVAAATRAQAMLAPAGPARNAALTLATAADTAAAVAAATAATVNTAVQSVVAPAVASDKAAFTSGSVTFSANSPGTWGAKLSVKIDRDGIDADVVARFGLTALTDLFNVTVVLDPPNGPRERIRNLTATSATHARAVEKVLLAESNWITATVDRTAALVQPVVTTAAQDPTVPANFGSTSTVAFFAGGRESAALANSIDYLGSAAATPTVTAPATKTGLYALDGADLFNLLCVPPDTRDGAVPVAVNTEALAYCVKRRAMLIVDPLRTWTVSTALSGATGLGVTGPAARNAVLYFPRVQMPDPMRGGQLDSFPACGVLAGVMARTDEARGVWKAPAGVDAALAGVAGLDVTLTDAENGQLNPVAVNCLRTFPIYGNLLWGARTMRGADQLADDYKYVPVRRLALFIEESLFRGLKWVVFEPNDEPLWALIRLNVGAFMQNLFRQGAFQGSSPREAFFVRCDAETTLPGDVNLGVVNIVVGFAPLKPAEFVVLQLQQIVAQNQ